VAMIWSALFKFFSASFFKDSTLAKSKDSNSKASAQVMFKVESG